MEKSIKEIEEWDDHGLIPPMEEKIQASSRRPYVETRSFMLPGFNKLKEVPAPAPAPPLQSSSRRTKSWELYPETEEI